jgi:hypothetical protein
MPNQPKIDVKLYVNGGIIAATLTQEEIDAILNAVRSKSEELLSFSDDKH